MMLDELLKDQLHSQSSNRRSLSDARVLVMVYNWRGWVFLPASKSFDLAATVNRCITTDG